jgi:hypothetical protein
VSVIAPAGLLLIFILSFLPWQQSFVALDRAVDLSRPNLWQLAFTQAGNAAFLVYVLLLILAAPIVIAVPLFEKNIVPAPAALRPYLPWSAVILANVLLAAWLFVMTQYVHYTFIAAVDPATIWMKLAFRLHTLMVIAAFLDIWLVRRKRRGLPEPRVSLQS